jgi:hypothetical protein
VVFPGAVAGGVDEGCAEEALGREEDDLQREVTGIDHPRRGRGHRDERDAEGAGDGRQQRWAQPVSKGNGEDDREVEEGKRKGASEDEKRLDLAREEGRAEDRE